APPRARPRSCEYTLRGLGQPSLPPVDRCPDQAEGGAALARTGGEVSEGLAADAARRRVVGGVKRRTADRIVDGQHRNARFAQRPRDAIVRGGLVEILDEEIDLATGRVRGVVERGPDVAAVVVEHQVDRQATGGENEAVSNLAAHGAGGLEGPAPL